MRAHDAHAERGLGGPDGVGLRVLERRAQPAHGACGFFGSAGVVEGEQAGEQDEGGRLGGDRVADLPCPALPTSGEGARRRGEVAPAVGGQHGGVEFGVQFGEHGDQAELMHRALLWGEGAACAQGVEHVVERGEGERAGVGGEHLFAVGVDGFGAFGDALAQRGSEAGVSVGEGEGFEAAGFDVDRTILQRASLRQCPGDMRTAGQHAEVEGVVEGDGNQFVVGQDGRVEELEGAVLGGFDGGDIARQAGELFAQFAAGFTEDPPVVAVSGALVLVAFGLHAFEQPLIDGRVAAAHLLGVEAEEVDDEHAARGVGEVAAVAVGAHDLPLPTSPTGWGRSKAGCVCSLSTRGEGRGGPLLSNISPAWEMCGCSLSTCGEGRGGAQRSGLLGGDDESSAKELHAAIAQTQIGPQRLR